MFPLRTQPLNNINRLAFCNGGWRALSLQQKHTSFWERLATENIKAFISLSLESLVNRAALSSKFQETGTRWQTAFFFFCSYKQNNILYGFAAPVAALRHACALALFVARADIWEDTTAAAALLTSRYFEFVSYISQDVIRIRSLNHILLEAQDAHLIKDTSERYDGEPLASHVI